MDKRKLSCILVAAMASVNVFAGGILTNTNQSVMFLKNPARDAAIGLDGVYSNPAGVVFMNEGFHIAVNWQMARQTRTITSTNPLFALGKKNDGKTQKTFEGIANAYMIPSLQAAYNKGDWSIQFNFSMPGGGGVCEYGSGLGSFEAAVGNIAEQLKGLGVEGYDVDAYMRGRQYYFGFQLGAAYKINENWSIYGGLRMLYGDASYKARLSNIMVKQSGEYISFDDFISNSVAGINQLKGAAALAQSMGYQLPDEQMEQLRKGEAALPSLRALEKYSQGVNLMSIQTGFGFAPIIGVDFKIANFNFAAKYEFNTEMKMKNHSTLDKAMEIEAVNKFQDGTDVDEDAPALLTVGAQWSVIPEVRLNLGYHHFYDKNAHWYNNAQSKLKHGTNEYLAGVEWDISPRVNISCGGQITRYGLSDDYMNDMSFVVNSYSAGFGLSYKATENITLTAAYFQTNYSDYEKTTIANQQTGVRVLGDSFTRTNRVIGLGCQVDF